jgi:hypothetical protein
MQSKMRQAEKIWALQAVCMMAAGVAMYVATMIRRSRPLNWPLTDSLALKRDQAATLWL